MSSPFVLVIDDDPGQIDLQKQAINADGQIVVEVLHPQDVTASHLDRASLVLVDYVLDTWPERGELAAISLQPATGLALLAVLQEHSHRSAQKLACAFTLHTGNAERLQHELAKSDHLVARAHNLDWVFAKEADNSQWVQVVELAKAVAALPTFWSVEDRQANVAEIQKWLSLPQGASWSERAWRDVEACHPPAHEFAATSHGVAIVRWMLHRILPYPCFLLDLHHLAARLHVTPQSLTDALQVPAFETWLSSAAYVGELAGFLGRRWWRSGIESLVFQLTKEDPANDALLLSRLQEKASALKSCDLVEPVVVLDHDYKAMSELAELGDAIRIAPDDWPPFADTARTTLAYALEDSRLKAIVIGADRERLGSS